MAPNGTENDTLTSRQEVVALALAAGQSIPEAAASCRAGKRSVKRWLACAAFARRVHELRAEMIGRALGRMADGMTEAADTLRKLLKAESEAVRLGASRSILELCVKLRESVELENRVVVLERHAAAKGGTNGQPCKPSEAFGNGHVCER
jgi:hypothetical protein